METPILFWLFPLDWNICARHSGFYTPFSDPGANVLQAVKCSRNSNDVSCLESTALLLDEQGWCMTKYFATEPLMQTNNKGFCTGK